MTSTTNDDNNKAHRNLDMSRSDDTNVDLVHCYQICYQEDCIKKQMFTWSDAKVYFITSQSG